MSTDLRDVFESAASRAPASTVDVDEVIRRGRRSRLVRRGVVGGSALLAVCVLGAGALAVGSTFGGTGGRLPVGTTGSPTPTPSTPTPTPTPHVTPPVDLTHVSLPDPAPGFPVRLSPDVVQQTGISDGSYWVADFQVADGPAGTSSYVTVMVGHFPIPRPTAANTIWDCPVVATPSVAGVSGYITREQSQYQLLFTTKHFSVEVQGDTRASPAQLLALGNAITGIG